MPNATVIHGDAQHLPLADNSVDAIVCDPPYSLSFMGRAWDSHDSPAAFQAWCQEWATEALRVLKPGGFLLAFGGTRTFHRLTCAIEDAGFEIRDSIGYGHSVPVMAWLSGSGFPKSLDVSKAIDKASGVERKIVAVGKYASKRPRGIEQGTTFADDGYVWPPGHDVTAPATDDARRWQGWGTALKPSHEPVIRAMKPHVTGSILVEIGSHLDRLETECKLRAKVAGANSRPTPHTAPEAKGDSAPALAATQPEDDPAKPTATGAADGSYVPTAMSASESTAGTCLSIVTSWRRCWAELCELTSTSTTLTTTRPTTDLTTLWSSLSKTTPESIIQGLSRGACSPSLVSVVDNLFAASVLSLRSIHALSAIETATGDMPTSRQGEAAPAYRQAWEPIVVARKPIQGTVAANVLQWGCGALNVDGCRVATSDDLSGGTYGGVFSGSRNPDGSLRKAIGSGDRGRWPTNVVLSHVGLTDGDGDIIGDACDPVCVPHCPVAELDAQSGVTRDGVAVRRNGVRQSNLYGEGYGACAPGSSDLGYGGTGGASRYFPTFRYQAKAPARERPKVNGVAHPTVKPVDLLRWMVRLVGGQPGSTILDMFAGSGTTLEAALLEGFNAIGVERSAEYLPLIQQRIDRATAATQPAPDDVAELTLFDVA